MNIRNLEPKALWNHFADVNAIPRASKKEDKIIRFMQEFAMKHALDFLVDEIGNVIIKKPATRGWEAKPTIALQGHLDMVHQKNAETNFDFEKEGIRMICEDDWVIGDGTTLGADNGIGVAAIMAVLSADDISHPSIEALFTIDEETGMTGALHLEGGILKAKYMLNLDTEEDTELTIGCAGGIDVTATGVYTEQVAMQGLGCRISVKGLTGGHSGMDIHLGRANANKVLNRILRTLRAKLQIQVARFDGGGLRNAIPREAYADIVVKNDFQQILEKEIQELSAVLKSEYQTTDPHMMIELTYVKTPGSVWDSSFQNSVFRALGACPNGIYRMSPEIKDLVQTSNNLARVKIESGQYQILCLTRSSVDTEKMEEAESIQGCFETMGAQVSLTGSYPGWTPLPEATLVKQMRDIYVKMFDSAPHVNACHAGLECGILGKNYPEMQMISFGPNIRGAHAPGEKVQISSVQKFWSYLLESLVKLEA